MAGVEVTRPSQRPLPAGTSGTRWSRRRGPDARPPVPGHCRRPVLARSRQVDAERTRIGLVTATAGQAQGHGLPVGGQPGPDLGGAGDRIDHRIDAAGAQRDHQGGDAGDDGGQGMASTSQSSGPAWCRREGESVIGVIAGENGAEWWMTTSAASSGPLRATTNSTAMRPLGGASGSSVAASGPSSVAPPPITCAAAHRQLQRLPVSRVTTTSRAWLSLLEIFIV